MCIDVLTLFSTPLHFSVPVLFFLTFLEGLPNFIPVIVVIAFLWLGEVPEHFAVRVFADMEKTLQNQAFHHTLKTCHVFLPILSIEKIMPIATFKTLRVNALKLVYDLIAKKIYCGHPCNKFTSYFALHRSIALIMFFLAGANANWDWSWRNPVPQGNLLNGAVYGHGKWVVVGDYGTIMTSVDGHSWTPQQTGFTSRILAVCTWPSGFVAVGELGTIFLSKEGISWTQVNSDSQNNYHSFRSVTWNGQRLVAVGGLGDGSYLDRPGAIVTSTDGYHWISTENLSKNYLNEVVASENLFVAVGFGGTVAVSKDGISWKAQKLVPANTLFSVNWNGSRFLAAGSDGIAWASSDGANWTQLATGFDHEITSIVWTGKEYVASGYRTLLHSTDGNIWSRIPQEEHRSFLTFANGGFLALYDWQIETSADGSTWKKNIFGHLVGLNSVVWTGKSWFALGGESPVLASVDGISWTAHPLALKADMYSVDWSGTELVAVGLEGLVLRSADGITWEENNPRLPFGLVKIRWLNSMHVAVGYNDTVLGGIYYSKDGKNWTGSQLRLFNPQSVEWTGKRWIVCGGGAGGHGIVTSIDGKYFSAAGGSHAGNLLSVCWNGNLAVAVGTGGQILSSPDGVSWSESASATREDLYSVIWVGNQFVASTINGEIVVSNDGKKWQMHRSPAGNWIHDLGWNGKRLVAVGSAGLILTADSNVSTHLVSKQPALGGIFNHGFILDIRNILGRYSKPLRQFR